MLGIRNGPRTQVSDRKSTLQCEGSCVISGAVQASYQAQEDVCYNCNASALLSLSSGEHWVTRRSARKRPQLRWPRRAMGAQQ